MSQQVCNLIIPREAWQPSEQFSTYEAYLEHMNSVFTSQEGTPKQSTGDDLKDIYGIQLKAQTANNQEVSPCWRKFVTCAL